MLRYCCLLFLSLVFITSIVNSQVELPEGEFCYSDTATIEWEIGGSSSLTNYDTFRMFLVEELHDGWVKVLYHGKIGYVQNPNCFSMLELHAQADPVIEDARNRINANPQDHEAFYNLAWASIMVGDYATGIASIEEAIALDPFNPDYNAIFSAAYTEVGREEDLFYYLIPDIPLQNDWYITGRGSENVYHSFFEDIPLIDHWMILRLITWTYVAVPEGWILSDNVGNSSIWYDPNMTDFETIRPSIMLSIMQDFYDGPIEGMPDYLFAIFAESGAKLVDSALLDDDTGYILFSFADSDDMWLRYGMLAFSRALPMDVDGGWRIFMYATTTKEEWVYFYPLMQAIISNARNLDFIPVGVMLPSNIDWQEE